MIVTFILHFRVYRVKENTCIAFLPDAEHCNEHLTYILSCSPHSGIDMMITPILQQRELRCRKTNLTRLPLLLNARGRTQSLSDFRVRFLYSILMGERLRPGEFKYLAQDHTTNKLGSQNLNSGYSK